jgi:diphthamide synthase (EF-2-diphthine--ammonia ligase)
MMTAKERGVKNFRVLNKQELADVLKNIGDQKAVDAIVAGAVARWKSGWGSKKNSKNK